MHSGHSEELSGFLLEEEVSAPALGSTHLPEASARPAGPPGLWPAAGGEEEKGGGGAQQEDRRRDGEVSWSSYRSCCSHVTLSGSTFLNSDCVELWLHKP